MIPTSMPNAPKPRCTADRPRRPRPALGTDKPIPDGLAGTGGYPKHMSNHAELPRRSTRPRCPALAWKNAFSLHKQEEKTARVRDGGRIRPLTRASAAYHRSSGAETPGFSPGEEAPSSHRRSFLTDLLVKCETWRRS